MNIFEKKVIQLVDMQLSFWKRLKFLFNGEWS